MWYRCYLPVPQCLNAYNLQTMSFLADICKCAREQARLGLDSMAVAVPGGGGAFGPCPPKANHRGPTYLLPPKPKPGLLDPLGPIAEVDFLSGFRAPRDRSGPAGRIGPRRKNQGSTERTQAPRDGPARRIRAPQDRSGPVRRIKALWDKSRTTERIRVSQYESGPRRTDQGPERRIRARMTNQGPVGQAGPRETDEGRQDEVGPRRTNRARWTKQEDESGRRGRNQGPAE